MIYKKAAFETNGEQDASKVMSNKREELKMELFNALTLDSQQSLVAWEAALPNTTSEHYRTTPETGDFTLVAIAYFLDGSVYDATTFAAYQNVTAALENLIEDLESNAPKCPIVTANSTYSYNGETDQSDSSSVSGSVSKTTITLNPQLEKRSFMNNCGWFCGNSAHCSGVLTTCKKCKSYESGVGKWWKHCSLYWG